MDSHESPSRHFAKGVGYKRTFTGCWNCRSRKVKCDERKPECTPCQKRGKKCSGYGQNLVWVSNDQRTYRHNGRRFLDPESTWKHWPILSYARLDDLIDACDTDLENGEPADESHLPFSVFRHGIDTNSCLEQQSRTTSPSWRSESLPNSTCATLLEASTCWPPQPWNEIQAATSPLLEDADISTSPASLIEPIVSSTPESAGDALASDMHDNNDNEHPEILDETHVEWQLTLPKAPRAENRLDSKDAFLFSNFLVHVAPLLTPVHASQNPWLRYPAIALHQSFHGGQKQLLHALMSLSAIYIGNMSGGTLPISNLGSNLYSKAMAELRSRLRDGSAGYLDLLMTMMIFVFIEMFEGNTKTWRCHLSAAWRLLKQYRASMSWNGSKDAWYATQSFHLLRIASETSAFSTYELSIADEMNSDADDDVSLKSLTCNPVFGWTIGASSSVMECIAEINKYYRLQTLGTAPPSTASASLKLSRMLFEDADSYPYQNTRSASNDEARAMRLHLRAFKAATVVYYHQTVHDISPRELSPYVLEVIASLSSFIEIVGCNYTLWPVFIAGVEVYTEQDKSTIIDLLDSATNVGMRHRIKIKAIVERVWDIRATTAVETGRQPEDVNVDWKRVQRELGMDVLLV